MTIDTGHPAGSAMVASSAGGFRDPTGLTRWLQVFLCIAMALSLVSLVSSLVELRLLSDMNFNQTVAPGAAEANDLRQQVIGIVRFTGLIVTIVLFAMWVYRVNDNAHRLGAADMLFTPGWAVGWYFIPIANLWKPYQAMKEIWQASANPANWQQQARGGILPLWWAMWIISNILNQISLRLSLRADTTPELINAGAFSAFSDGVDIVSFVIALVLVTRIHGMQVAHRPRSGGIAAA